MSFSKHNVGVKDTHYLSLWDKNDLPFIEKLQTKIRGTHDENLINQYFDILNKKWNDHHPTPEPLDLSVDEKYIMTYKGLAKFCRLITRQDTTTFTHVAVGNGVLQVPMPFDDLLVAEQYVIPISVNGFLEASGTSVRYSGTFGANTVSDSYRESLVRNTSSAGSSGKIVMCIASFSDSPIVHTQGSTGFSCAGSIEFNVIADLQS